MSPDEPRKPLPPRFWVIGGIAFLAIAAPVLALIGYRLLVLCSDFYRYLFG